MYMRKVPSANVAHSSRHRYARWSLEGSKKPSFSSSARQRAKSWSIGASGSALLGVSAGLWGRALSIFQAFGERMWNSLNASVASAPVLESM